MQRRKRDFDNTQPLTLLPMSDPLWKKLGHHGVKEIEDYLLEVDVDIEKKP